MHQVILGSILLSTKLSFLGTALVALSPVIALAVPDKELPPDWSAGPVAKRCSKATQPAACQTSPADCAQL